MGIPLKFLGGFHWVDRITVDIYPLKVEDESNQIVKIRFFEEDKFHESGEITAFTNHKEVQVEMIKKETKEKGLVILIEKLEESKNGRNNKKS